MLYIIEDHGEIRLPYDKYLSKSTASLCTSDRYRPSTVLIIRCTVVYNNIMPVHA